MRIAEPWRVEINSQQNVSTSRYQCGVISRWAKFREIAEPSERGRSPEVMANAPLPRGRNAEQTISTKHDPLL